MAAKHRSPKCSNRDSCKRDQCEDFAERVGSRFRWLDPGYVTYDIEDDGYVVLNHTCFACKNWDIISDESLSTADAREKIISREYNRSRNDRYRYRKRERDVYPPQFTMPNDLLYRMIAIGLMPYIFKQ